MEALIPSRRKAAWSLLLLLSVANMATAATIKVLSFNVAGIPVVHEKWPARRAEIARQLRDADYDIIGLQEMWPDKDAMALFHESGYPFYARYPSLGGTGLMILSRHPIMEIRERPFSCFPPAAWTVYQGETLSTKGVLMARVRTPSGELDVYDTHLVADYPTLDYSAVRTAQVFELAETIAGLSGGRPHIVLGDLNTGPGDAEYEAARKILGLSDACRTGEMEHCPDHARGTRIDHVLYSPGLKALGRGRLPYDLPPGIGPTPLSDHPGIWAELGPAASALSVSGQARAGALAEMEAFLDRSLKRLYSDRKWWSWLPLYGTVHWLSYGREIAAMEAVRFRVQSAALVAGRSQNRQNTPR